MNAQAMQMHSYVEKLMMIVDGTQRDSISPVSSHAIGSQEKTAAPKPGKPTVRKKLIRAIHNVPKGKAVRPEEMIPFEKDGFKDF